VKNKIIIKNNFSKVFLKTKNLKIKNSVISSNLKQITKEIEKKKDVFHSFSKSFNFNFRESDLKRYNRFDTIAIIGMGGSILGSKAIFSFLRHKIKKKILFLDNLNENKVKDLINEQRKNNILFIIISKSGNTIETLTNVNLLKNAKLRSSNTIVITEKGLSALNDIALKAKIPLIEHKKYIGGRYSVLSEVGMVPAKLMGLKINNFRKNLLNHFKNKNKKSLISSISEMSKIFSSPEISSIVFFNYCSQLDEFTQWAQQLFAESLGKKGKGLTPVLSNGPKDHHSLLQLYLEGPKDKVFYIFSSKDIYNYKVRGNYLNKKLKFLKNKKLNKIILSQKNAFIQVLKKKGISYREFIINDFSEEAIGELFSYFMLETVLIGRAIKVNPFNQPSVEEVKALTKKYLS